MTVGERGESTIDKCIRHTQETEKEIEGWKNELNRAMEMNKENDIKYAKIMIAIHENTLDILKSIQELFG